MTKNSEEVVARLSALLAEGDTILNSLVAERDEWHVDANRLAKAARFICDNYELVVKGEVGINDLTAALVAHYDLSQK